MIHIAKEPAKQEHPTANARRHLDQRNTRDGEAGERKPHPANKGERKARRDAQQKRYRQAGRGTRCGARWRRSHHVFQERTSVGPGPIAASRPIDMKPCQEEENAGEKERENNHTPKYGSFVPQDKGTVENVLLATPCVDRRRRHLSSKQVDEDSDLPRQMTPARIHDMDRLRAVVAPFGKHANEPARGDVSLNQDER